MFGFSPLGLSLIGIIFSFLSSHSVGVKNSSVKNYQKIISLSPPLAMRQGSSTGIEQNNRAEGQSENSTHQFATPTPLASIDLSQEEVFILNAINQYRHANGLSPVVANDFTCDFAKTRAQEIASGFDHSGFIVRLQQHTLPYPTYDLVTENIAETGDFQEVVTLWSNSASHAANMRANTPYVCVKNYGSYYAYEGWKPQ